jgi:hypothetical protein
MLLRRALIVAGGGFMLPAGLAVVVVIMTLPRWVLTVAMTSPGDMLQKRVTIEESIAAHMAAICSRKTVAEAEPAHTVQNERLSSPPVPNDRWRAFLSQMQEGDELWMFCTPLETWEHMAGRRGIALVRHGKWVAKIITLLQ